MSTETKSAGVPAGATHVCTKCGRYWAGNEPVSLLIDYDCLCEDFLLVPIAEVGPAPTTAAPAELPNRREFHASTPAEFAAAAKVAQGGDTIIVPDWPLPREAVPAEQLSGKVVRAGEHMAADCPLPLTPAEQPGKAAGPRPAQPQAPAEPWRSPGMGVYLHELLSAAYDRVPLPFAALRQDLVEAAEHFREHPPEVAAPLREERDRLAGKVKALGEEAFNAARNYKAIEKRAERAEAKVAERDARIATLEETIRKAPHAPDCLMRLRVCVGKACTCWKRGFPDSMPSLEELAAALGAPEGQPERCPGSMQPSGLPITTTARNVSCPICFQLVGFYGVGGEYMIAIHNRPAHMPGAAPEGQPPAPPQELLGKDGGIASREELMKRLEEARLWIASGIVTPTPQMAFAMECMEAAVAGVAQPSAPPRKAPQEDAQAWVKGWLAGRDAAANTAAFTHMRLGGPSRPSSEYIAREIRELPAPSSPEEQPFASTGAYKIPPATTKKEG